MKLVLYSKPGCHLCEGLQHKLEQIREIDIELEIRDITTRQDWLTAYQYEIPVLYYMPDSDLPDSDLPDSDSPDSGSPDSGSPDSNLPGQRLPRLSPRGSVAQLQKMLERMLQTSTQKPRQ